MNSLCLTILGCLYPQSCIRSKSAGVQVITLVGIRTIDAIQINFAFVDWYCVSSAFVSPACRELHIYFSVPVHRTVFHLHPAELTVSISSQVKRSVLRLWRTDHESLLEQVNLSLQHTQVTLRFCVMWLAHGSSLHHRTGQPQVSTGLPSALPVKGSPLQCSPLHRFCFPMQAPYSKADALSS